MVHPLTREAWKLHDKNNHSCKFHDSQTVSRTTVEMAHLGFENPALHPLPHAISSACTSPILNMDARFLYRKKCIFRFAKTILFFCFTKFNFRMFIYSRKEGAEKFVNLWNWIGNN